MTAGRPKLKDKKESLSVKFSPNEKKSLDKARRKLHLKRGTFIRFASLTLAENIILNGINADDMGV